MIAGVGSGWVFLINALSFLAVLCSLSFLRIDGPKSSHRAIGGRGSLVEGFRYVWRRPVLKVIMLMLFLVGMFGLNFPIFISTMSVTVFHAGAGQFGLLTSMMAAGSVTGALMVAARAKPTIAVLLTAAAAFAAACGLAALMPSYALFGLALFVVGIAAQTLTTSTNSLVQLSTEPGMRGRIIAILLAITLGGTPIGAPIVGWLADTFGPRWALGAAAAAGLLAAAAALIYLMKHRQPVADASMGQG